MTPPFLGYCWILTAQLYQKKGGHCFLLKKDSVTRINKGLYK